MILGTFKKEYLDKKIIIINIVNITIENILFLSIIIPMIDNIVPKIAIKGNKNKKRINATPKNRDTTHKKIINKE